MKKIINTTIASLLALIVIVSCKKSEFEGADNLIASFQLIQGNTTLKAAISPDSIIITAPGSMSVTGATVAFVLSENAKIAPNPSEITDWEQQRDFTVTAANGTQATYHYKLVRNIISRDGDITLNTQQDVDNLAALKIDRINGNLIIGSTSGSDTIRSLAKLTGLKSIAYDLIINANYKAKDLSGLENLTAVGTLKISNNNFLKTIILPKLEIVYSDLLIEQSEIKTVSFPLLRRIDQSLQLLSCDSVATLEFPKLQSVLNNLTLQGSFADNTQLSNTDFPALQNVGGIITYLRNARLTSINFPVLTKAAAISINTFPELTALKMPLLAIVNGELNLGNNPLLNTLTMGTLKEIGGNFILQSAAITDLEAIKNLTRVGGSFEFGFLSSLQNLNGLKALQTVGANFNINGLAHLNDDNLSFLSGLKSVGNTLNIAGISFKKFTLALDKVGTIAINGAGLNTITEIDVSKSKIETALRLSSISTPAILRGADINTYSLALTACDFNLTTDLYGFKQVKDFNYSYTNAAALAANQSIHLEKVTGNMFITAMGNSSFGLPNLTEVGGTGTITISSRMNLFVPLLKSVNGAFTLNLHFSNMDLLSLPALETVNGNLSFVTANGTNSVAEIKAPKLTTVNGILRIQGQATATQNTRMTNLDGFSSLTKATGITIAYNQKLVDYTGLKNVAASGLITAWSVMGNSYNPTLKDITDGKYVKP